jgi:hypothetical protein
MSDSDRFDETRADHERLETELRAIDRDGTLISTACID